MQSLWCWWKEIREGKKGKDAGEILCYALFFFLARHLTTPCKRQIQFSLLSCQSKLCYSFSLCLSLSLLSLLHFHGCRVVKAAYTLFKQWVHPPTHTLLCARILHMPAHPSESLEPTTNAKHFHHPKKRRGPSASPCLIKIDLILLYVSFSEEEHLGASLSQGWIDVSRSNDAKQSNKIKEKHIACFKVAFAGLRTVWCA